MKDQDIFCYWHHRQDTEVNLPRQSDDADKPLSIVINWSRQPLQMIFTIGWTLKQSILNIGSIVQSLRQHCKGAKRRLQLFEQ